jgi:hypothetical protein
MATFEPIYVTQDDIYPFGAQSVVRNPLQTIILAQYSSRDMGQNGTMIDYKPLKKPTRPYLTNYRRRSRRAEPQLQLRHEECQAEFAAIHREVKNYVLTHQCFTFGLSPTRQLFHISNICDMPLSALR